MRKGTNPDPPTNSKPPPPPNPPQNQLVCLCGETTKKCLVCRLIDKFKW